MSVFSAGAALVAACVTRFRVFHLFSFAELAVAVRAGEGRLGNGVIKPTIGIIERQNCLAAADVVGE